jgi:hypothetical protein
MTPARRAATIASARVSAAASSAWSVTAQRATEQHDIRPVLLAQQQTLRCLIGKSVFRMQQEGDVARGLPRGDGNVVPQKALLKVT